LSTRLQGNPRGVGRELHSKRVKVAEAGQGWRWPHAGIPRHAWSSSAVLQMLITLPTPNVEELLVCLRELPQKLRVGLERRTLKVTKR
jgi:hypothetical protein